MLRQPALQDLGQNLFFRIHPAADRTRVQVRTKAVLQVRSERPALSIQEMKPCLLAIHRAFYLA